jgi:ABC-type lipoprotein release transport system permease subunit
MVAVPGVLIGIACALGATRLVRSQLYGVGPGDPQTILGAALLFLLVTTLATTVPALRASNIDPTDALRRE